MSDRSGALIGPPTRQGARYRWQAKLRKQSESFSACATATNGASSPRCWPPRATASAFALTRRAWHSASTRRSTSCCSPTSWRRGRWITSAPRSATAGRRSHSVHPAGLRHRAPCCAPCPPAVGDQRLRGTRRTGRARHAAQLPRHLHTAASGRLARQRQKSAQVDERARFERLIENLPVGVCFIDTDGNTLLSNPKYDEYVPNRKIPSAAPDRARRWVGPGQPGQVIPPSQYVGARALRGEQVNDRDYRYYPENGGERWLRLSGVPSMTTPSSRWARR